MINNIQIIRAFAALNVVLLHTLFAANSYGLPAKYLSVFNEFEWGNNGVDLFFVVSGFVMVLTQANRPKSPMEFLKNRIIRIIPIYWALTLLFVAIYIVLPSAFRETSITGQHLFSSLFLISNLVVGQNPVLFVGWTLEYEMLFYLVFALGIFFSTQNAKILFPAIVLLSLVTFTRMDAIVLEFIFGMAAALIYLRTPSFTLAKYLLPVGMILLGTSIFIESDLHRAVKWGVPSFLIVLSVCYLPQSNSRLLQMLGDASYSIYLIQIFTIAAFYKASNIFPQWIASDLIAILCLVFTAIIGVIVHFYLEKPLVNLVKKIWERAQPQTALVRKENKT